MFETSSILPCFPLRHVHVDTTCTIPSRGESSLNIYERAESASVQALGNAASFFLAINPASMRPPDRRDVGPTSRRGVSSSSPSSIVGRALKTLVEISIRLRRPSGSMEENTCWKRLQVGKIAMEITLDPFPLVFQKRRFDFSLCDRLKIKIWDRSFRILTRFFEILLDDFWPR